MDMTRRLLGGDEPKQAEPIVKEPITSPRPRAGDLIDEIKQAEAAAQAQKQKSTRKVWVCICGSLMEDCGIGPHHLEDRPLPGGK